MLEGVIVEELRKITDSRGWLVECFRSDEIPSDILPVMAYVSMTLPGEIRGPHEHIYQTDYFIFPGTSKFDFCLWDNREDSKTLGIKLDIGLEEGTQYKIIIPPRIVHGYKNVGDKQGLVLNFPNRLYAGKEKKSAVDEVRYEGQKDTLFKIL